MQVAVAPFRLHAGPADRAPNSLMGFKGMGDLGLSLTFVVTRGSQAVGGISPNGNTGIVYQVGDTWQVIITGPSNVPVTVTGTHPDGTTDTNYMGSTDWMGNFLLAGSYQSGDVGTWVEQWYVGGQPAGILIFQVIPVQSPVSNPPVTNTTPTPTVTSQPPVSNPLPIPTTTGGTTPAGTTPPTPTVGASGAFDLRSFIQTPAGMAVAGGAGLVLLLALTGRH